VKKLLTFTLTIVIILSLTTIAFASPGQNPNQNPGSPEQVVGGVTVTVTGGGNNLVIRAIDNATGESVVIPRAGNGTFSQSFEVFGYYVSIQVQGNSLRSVEATSLLPDNGGNDNDNVPAQPVNIGFIGFWFDANLGRVLNTSFFWYTLEEGQYINWDVVEEAYANWVARGGLPIPVPSQGWQTSGPASLFFDGARPAVNHSDFTAGQLETFYGAFFMSPGFDFNPSCPEFDNAARAYCRYTAYVYIWNQLWLGNWQPNGMNFRNDARLASYGGSDHYHALLAHYGASSLPPFFAFSVDMADDYDYWADRLEPGLLLAFTAEELAALVELHGVVVTP
jgi:hypothetical protein